jgi:hypothetical protein
VQFGDNAGLECFDVILPRRGTLNNSVLDISLGSCSHRLGEDYKAGGYEIHAPKPFALHDYITDSSKD